MTQPALSRSFRCCLVWPRLLRSGALAAATDQSLPFVSERTKRKRRRGREESPNRGTGRKRASCTSDGRQADVSWREGVCGGGQEGVYRRREGSEKCTFTFLYSRSQDSLSVGRQDSRG